MYSPEVSVFSTMVMLPNAQLAVGPVPKAVHFLHYLNFWGVLRFFPLVSLFEIV